MQDVFVSALRKKYEAEVDVAKATIKVYFDKPVGIGEHPQFIEEIDKQLEKITCAKDKIRVLDDLYPNEDDMPF